MSTRRKETEKRDKEGELLTSVGGLREMVDTVRVRGNL